MRGRALAPACLLAALALALGHGSLAQDAEQRRGFSVKITAPADKEFVFGKTRLAATVKAGLPQDVDRVEFLVGDQLIFVDREPPYECFHDFGEASKSWVVRAVAYHKEGLSASDAVVTRKLEVGYTEEVNRVILWASVADKADRFVPDLAKPDFQVFEDGVEKEIRDFYPEDRPITLAILLDSSGSMREQLMDLHDAARAFIDTLRPEDRALVIDFDEKVFLVQDLTADHEALKEAVSSTEALGGTAIYDALHAAFRKLKNVQGRKAIVLLSDGDDTSSQFDLERTLEEAKAQNVTIYGIGLGGAFSGRTKGVLKDFSEFTGGREYFVGKAAELAGVYQRIADNLRRQYYLTYSTSNSVWDGRWIKIRIATKNSDYQVRARRGFFAVREVGKPG